MAPKAGKPDPAAKKKTQPKEPGAKKNQTQKVLGKRAREQDNAANEVQKSGRLENPMADSPVKTRERNRSARGLENKWVAETHQGPKRMSPSKASPKKTRQQTIQAQRTKAFAFHEQDPPAAKKRKVNNPKPQPKQSTASTTIVRDKSNIKVPAPAIPANNSISTPAHQSTFRPWSHQKLAMDVVAQVYPSAQLGPVSKGPPNGFPRLPPLKPTGTADPGPPVSQHIRRAAPTPPSSEQDILEDEGEITNDLWADTGSKGDGGETEWEGDNQFDGDPHGGEEEAGVLDGQQDLGMESEEEAPGRAPSNHQAAHLRSKNSSHAEDLEDAQGEFDGHPSESGDEESEEIQIDLGSKRRRVRRSRKQMEAEDEGDDSDENSGKGTANRALRGIPEARKVPVRLAYIRLRSYIATCNPFPSPEEESAMIDKAWRWVQRNREEFANLKLLPEERPVIHVFITNIRGKIKASARKKIESAYPWGHRKTENIELYNRLMENDAYTHKDPMTLDGRWLNRLLFSIIQDVFFCGKNADGYKHKKLFSPVPLELIALVYTAIHCALDEWEKGYHLGLQFTVEAYQAIYERHLDNLLSLRDHDESAVDVICRIVWERCSGKQMSDKARPPPARHTVSDHEKTVRGILAEAHLDAL